MKLTFLVDNNTLIDRYFLAEPGLSIFIQDDDTRILFDAGYSDAFLTNARRMAIDLLHLDWFVLSHGHLDHSWGVVPLIQQYLEAQIEGREISRPALLAHPLAFASKAVDGLPEIGSLLGQDKLESQFRLNLTEQPYWLSDRLVYLGQIDRQFDFEKSSPIGQRAHNTRPVPDDLPDDTALAYVSDKGLVVIAGCAHAGICNTVEQARHVTGVGKVHSVLGGFHLQNASAERLDRTAAYLSALDLDSLYACHCTDLAAKIALAQTCPVCEVGVGLSLEF